MKNLLTFLLITLSITSCKLEHVILVEKYDPVDYYEDRVYPIKDTLSCAIGFRKLNDYKLLYAKDADCYVVSEFAIGDTLTIIIKNHKAKSKK